MEIGINNIAYVLGGQRVSNEEVARAHGFDLSFINEKLGIKTRYEVTAEQSTAELACLAANRLLSQTGIEPGSIGLVVVVTQTPDFQLPHTAAAVQDRLGMLTGCASFDISLGCSGYVYGLTAVASFMEAASIDYGILVTA